MNSRSVINISLFSVILLFLIAGMFMPASAQGIKVSGTVRDTVNGKQVKEAKITVVQTQQEVTTDQAGNYQIILAKPGNYTLACFAWGLQTVTVDIRVDKDPLVVNFQLKPFETQLSSLTVEAEKDNDFGISRLKPVEGTAIYAGKKNDVIMLDDANANLATNNSRQIYSKVAGLNIWENDGAGIQLGIGGRGLSPSRSSNFNMRQNGYDISADALGYPESYYTPPSEAIDQIQIVRGAASLQYGTQFGGMVNFRLKKGPADKPLDLKLRTTIGSFNFTNIFLSAGGTKGKVNYYVFVQGKGGDGWRPNSSFNTGMAYGNMYYKLSEKITISAEVTYMEYLAQQPGGLTDALFEQDPRQSIRDRNWFRVQWKLASLGYHYRISDKAELNSTFFGLSASREALGFLGQISRTDPGGERNLLSDYYQNFGNETRFIQRYELAGNNVSVFLFGGRYYRGFTNRKQGNAPAGNEDDFKYLHPDNLEHSEYDFPSENIAFFAENLFQVTPRLSITPGVRFEYIYTSADGYYKTEYRNLADSVIFTQINQDQRSNPRSFVLAGIGTGYKPTKHTEVYANFSQNYRSINFNDMRVVNPNYRVDPRLKDETGYSADLGYRGNIRNKLNFDASLFLLSYNNRIGEVLMTDTVLFAPYRYRTNVSDSRSYGLETFAEVNINRIAGMDDSKNSFSVFSNLTLMDAQYINSEESAYEGKKVELVPPLILKTGVTWHHKKFKATCQYSYTAEHYTDATNAEFTSNAVNGIIPAYYVVDLSLQYKRNAYSVEGNINNITNNYYFTRRASGYPGPGIIPADGISFFLTIQYNFRK